MGATPASSVAGAAPPAPASGKLGPPIAPGPAAGSGGGPGSKASTPAQREAWREKARRRAASRKASLAPLPAAGRPGASSAGGPAGGGVSPGGVAPAGPAPIPWTGETLKPLFDQLIPAVEKLAVERLASKAAKIDPVLAPTVAKDAAWNPAAKVGLSTAGPQCAAEMLTDLGIGADKAHWAALVISAGTIAAAHVMLAGRLEAMARAKSAGTAPEPSKSAAVPGDGNANA